MPWYNIGMRSIAENASDFVDLRTADGGNCVCVDKTDYFHRLVTAGSKKPFFIARPRRFGKSLMITTFKYIFERNLKILFWAFGLETICEDRQTGGQADIVVKYHKAIYVFELKRDGTATEALAQIGEKGYAGPYLADGRPVYLIGLAFDSKTRQLTDAAYERV